MVKLQVLGPGCMNCRRLARHVEEAARHLGLDFELEKVEDLDRIVDLGVIRTPGLLVDGQVVVAGRVPSVAEIEGMLSDR